MSSPCPLYLLILLSCCLTTYSRRNGHEDSVKVKWDGVRCLFEDAQSDMLLLLDSCAAPDPAPSGNHGTKQAIAAWTAGHELRGGATVSFTANLVEALQKLSSTRSFSARRLYDEVLSLQQQQLRQMQAQSITNGEHTAPQSPVFFTITPGKGHDLALAPTSRRPSRSSPPNNAGSPDHLGEPGHEEQPIDPNAVADIKLDEARILVCTTFVGDASPDMSFFHQWLQNTPSMGAKIAVEGMFLGPPTMLLISMPHSIWNVVQHDKVCCFLGYITSHNMLHLYQRLVGPAGPKPSAKEVEDGKILLEAREMGAVPPAHLGQERDPREAAHLTPNSREGPSVSGRPSYQPAKGSARVSYVPINPRLAPGKLKDEHEGSAEMREAAEQLKALSHVRHRSDEGPHAAGRPRTSLPNGILHSDTVLSSAHEQGLEDALSPGKPRSPTNRVKVPRHALPKHETVCNHCSHTPFRDSSSLRKHIAAAHTRPFPCAFSFAGCNSTFGSKNEWKRHITSQHLCLQYYRCSECPQSPVEGKANEFNRKDLFTQHLRRMHAPPQVKRLVSKGDSETQAEWEQRVKSLQESCLVNRRHPPQKSACPNPGCQNVFEGPAAWDEWTEHVGRHMEKGEADNLGVDQYLIDWALKEGIIDRKPGGGYHLCYTNTNNSNGGGDGGSVVESKEPISPSQAVSSQPDLSPMKTAPPDIAMDVDK